MRRWYAHSNAFMSDDFEQSNMTAVYVPEESDVEAVAQGLWERDRTIDCETHRCHHDRRYCVPPWHRAHVLDRNEYLEEAREALRILGVLG